MRAQLQAKTAKRKKEKVKSKLKRKSKKRKDKKRKSKKMQGDNSRHQNPWIHICLDYKLDAVIPYDVMGAKNKKTKPEGNVMRPGNP